MRRVVGGAEAKGQVPVEVLWVVMQGLAGGGAGCEAAAAQACHSSACCMRACD